MWHIIYLMTIQYTIVQNITKKTLLFLCIACTNLLMDAAGEKGATGVHV